MASVSRATTQSPIVFLDRTFDEKSPPAYFLSMTIANFRCFRSEQTLDLSDGNGRPSQWTIILGDNGVGKTSLLQCLAALQPRAARTGDNEGYIPFFHDIEATNLFSKWLFKDENATELFYLGSNIYHGARLNATEKGEQLNGYGAVAFSPSAVNLMVIDEDIAGLVCYGYGATRRMGKTSLSERRDHTPSASLFSSDVELMNAEEWLLQADYAASRQTKNKRRAQARRDQIKDVLLRLLPDVSDIRFAPSAQNDLETTVQVKTPYGWVHIQELSLGYITLISWVVDLASRLFDRYPNSENPLAEPAIVLVDEIDLHLHPKWQRTLISFLCDIFCNTQFIATAHSPLVVQAATNANIVLLRREGNHVVIDNDVKAIEGWRVDQILTSDLFGLESARPPQLDKALAERQRILSKAKLSKADEDELQRLEAQIGNLPFGETPDDIEAMDVIRRAAELLKRK